MIERVALALIVAILGLIVWFIQRAIVNAENSGKEIVKTNSLLENISETVRMQGVTTAKNNDKIDELGRQLTKVATKQDGMEKTVDEIVRRLNQ